MHRPLNWTLVPETPDFFRQAFEEYIRHQIATTAASSTHTQFGRIRTCLRCAIEDRHLLENGNIDESYFTDVEEVLKKDRLSGRTINDNLSALRLLYTWAADADFDGFDPDVATALEDKTLKNFPSNEAVLREDPNQGPLPTHEYMALTTALRAEIVPETRKLSLRDTVVCLLATSFGLYARHMQLMNEDDYYTETLSDGTVKHFIRIPRIKKRAASPRGQWKVRALDDALGLLVQEMIASNGVLREKDPLWVEGDFDKALFHGELSKSIAETSFRRDAFRTSRFNPTLERVVRALGLKNSAGRPLNLTFRRLRYTYAARLVSLNASPMEVAEALDHSSTQCVMVYFNGRYSLLRRMEKKMALELARVSQLFSGIIVSRENVPADKNNKAPIAWASHEERRVDLVGSCGKYDHCALAMPKACYTCRLFMPWLEAPHEKVLEDLIAESKAKEAAGMPAPVVKLLDEVIFAVAEVVRLCELRAKGATISGADVL